ncbi:hypothetical protein CDAR_265731 [Caerostris darwini]|uniref:Uncharacterized protein n=1 Tax=Caerostris darwini TaxID=1538125 RepID=A0AAV4T0Z6_9ARAC|nr:hypothetical protein CDAR_265731 [Caerostris darwini]
MTGVSVVGGGEDLLSFFCLVSNLQFRGLVSQLLEVSCSSIAEQLQRNEEIRIPCGTGIVGYAVKCRESLNIPDCYKGEVFWIEDS